MPKYQVTLGDGPVLVTRTDGSTERHTVKDGLVTVPADQAAVFLADLPGAALVEAGDPDDSAPPAGSTQTR